MSFEQIMKIEKSKIETMKSNNEKLKGSGMINKKTYNHNRMLLNGIEAVQKLKSDVLEV